MNWWQKPGKAFHALFRKKDLDAEMAEEMRSHIAMQTEENVGRGMKPEEAGYVALREFGSESIKEECRERRGVQWIENLLQDLRFGVRALIRNKTFSAAIIITLGLAIGGNTALFSIVNAVLLRPLPFPKQERLVQVSATDPATFGAVGFLVILVTVAGCCGPAIRATRVDPMEALRSE